MACTLSNRETFLIMQWIDNNLERRARLRAYADRIRFGGIEHAIPRMARMITEELDLELPELVGLGREMLKSGLTRVNFIELAVVVLTEAEIEFSPTPVSFV